MLNKARDCLWYLYYTSGMLDSITSETGLPVTDDLSKHSGHRDAGKKHLKPELSSTVQSHRLSHSQGNHLS